MRTWAKLVRVDELRLEACRFVNLARWQWVLTEASGKPMAEHEVRLDPGHWQFEAFTNLQEYLRWHVAPDRRIEDEARIVAEVGEWMGMHVFGPVAPAMVSASPATVRVVVPNEGRSLLFRPLELARMNGRSLALQGVTLVMQPNSDAPEAATKVGSRLRVLGLFSLPQEGRALNLRKERQGLVRLLSEIAAAGRAVDMRMLQYGVTRTRLQEVLRENGGWDVIHLSGHGAPGELLLEAEDGSVDRVSAADLADMLALTRGRVKLVSVSACWSAALTAAESRRLLRLPITGNTQVPDGSQSSPDAAVPGWGDDPLAGALATELSDKLRCAVLAMRFPVVDEFATALARRLYDLLARQGQLLTQALSMALRDTVSDPPTAACPALSAGTPALFGSCAVNLRLAAPRRRRGESYDPAAQKLAAFPPQPDQLVGRTAMMAQASAALAEHSGNTGVLLYGMPGGGKTACAVELAYTHEHAFERLVWFKAPDEGLDTAGALTDFALAMEAALPGLQIAHVLDTPTSAAAVLPQLMEMCDHTRMLIVVDNIDSLMCGEEQWRDDQWRQVMAALCGHSGLSRVILTSRRVPVGLDGRVRTLAVGALTLDESLLLARELPHLRRLIDGQMSELKPAAARNLALRLLKVAQGHPKLLELADGQAADPDRLRAMIEKGDQAWRQAGGVPEGFFAVGRTQAVSEDYLHVLSTWTQAVSDALAPGDRELFWFLCCLNEADRNRHVLEDNWELLWRRLDRVSDPPRLDQGLAVLDVEGLAAIQHAKSKAVETYGIHPEVAAAGRGLAGDEFYEAVNTQLADYWTAVADQAKGREAKEQVGGTLIRASLGATPYLMRLGHWSKAFELLENVTLRDRSRKAARAVLPALRTIAAAAIGTDAEAKANGALANALQWIEPRAAEAVARAALDAALSRGNYEDAAPAAGTVVRYCRMAGRLAEALTVVEQQITYTQRAGFGPWSQLHAAVYRLGVLIAMGQFGTVLSEVYRLRDYMNSLPATSSQHEVSTPWSVREDLFNTGREAALQLGLWSEALDLNAAVVTSSRARGAPESEITRDRFNDYGPLLKLARLDEALALLLECRDAFEAGGDILMLGKALSALADIEDERGHGDIASSMEREALRYEYLTGDVSGILVSHSNLGTYLREVGNPSAGLGHHMASALIMAVAGSKIPIDPIGGAVADLRLLEDDAEMPDDLDQLCRRVGQVPGVDLARLLAVLAADLQIAESALQELIARIRARASSPSISPYLAAWDPVIAAIIAVRRGETQAAAALDDDLAQCDSSDRWSALAGAIRRLLGGDVSLDPAMSLDEISTTIATRALGALAGRITISLELWRAMPIRWLLGSVVAALGGDLTAAENARRGTEALARNPESTALARALDEMLDGQPALGLTSRFSDPAQSAVIATVLSYTAAANPAVPSDLRDNTAAPEGDGADEEPATLLSSRISHSFAQLDQKAQRLLPAVCLLRGITDSGMLAAFSDVPTVPERFVGATQQDWEEVLEAAAQAGLLTKSGTGLYQIHPALIDYLDTRWRKEEPADYEVTREAATRALVTAYAVLGTWLRRQVWRGHMGPAFTLIGLERRNFINLIGFALEQGLWEQAEAMAGPLGDYWEARGLDDEADAWTDRVRLATEGLDGTPPGLDSPAGSLWLYFTGSQGDRRRRQLRFDEAARIYQRIVTELQSQPTSPTQQWNLANAYHHIGLVTYMQGELDDAEGWCRKSLAIREDLGDRDGMATSYHQLGLITQDRGRLDNAGTWYRKSLALMEDIRNQNGVAAAYHQLGSIAHARGRLEEAESLYRRSAALYEKLGYMADTATCYHSLGNIAFQRNNMDDAEDWYRRSLAISEELTDQNGIARSYYQLGIVAQERRLPDDAETWYRESLAIYQEVGDRPAAALTYSQLGLLAEEHGHPDGALECMVRCVALFGEVPHPSSGTALRHLAHLTDQLGIEALKACWRHATGKAVPQPVLDYIDSHPPGSASR